MRTSNNHHRFTYLANGWTALTCPANRRDKNGRPGISLAPIEMPPNHPSHPALARESQVWKLIKRLEDFASHDTLPGEGNKPCLDNLYPFVENLKRLAKALPPPKGGRLKQDNYLASEVRLLEPESWVFQEALDALRQPETRVIREASGQILIVRPPASVSTSDSESGVKFIFYLES